MGRPIVVDDPEAERGFARRRPSPAFERGEVHPLDGEDEHEEDAHGRVATVLCHLGDLARAYGGDDDENGHDREDAVTDGEIEQIGEEAARGPGDAVAKDDVLGRLDGDVGVERLRVDVSHA